MFFWLPKKTLFYDFCLLSFSLAYQSNVVLLTEHEQEPMILHASISSHIPNTYPNSSMLLQLKLIRDKLFFNSYCQLFFIGQRRMNYKKEYKL